MDTYAHAVIGNADSFRGAAKDGEAGLALAGLADVVVVRTGIVGDHGGLVIVVVNLLLIAPGESDTLLVALNVAYDTAKADPHGVPCILATLEDGEARCVGQHVRRIDGHTFCIGEVGFYESGSLVFCPEDVDVEQFILVCFMEAVQGIDVSLLCHFDAIVAWY